MIELTCPKCGGKLKTDEKREFIFCEYCGNKIMMDSMNIKIDHKIDHNITYREIDEAKIEKQKRKASVAESIKDIFESFFDAVSDFFGNLFLLLMFIAFIAFAIWIKSRM